MVIGTLVIHVPTSRERKQRKHHHCRVYESFPCLRLLYQWITSNENRALTCAGYTHGINIGSLSPKIRKIYRFATKQPDRFFVREVLNQSLELNSIHRTRMSSVPIYPIENNGIEQGIHKSFNKNESHSL